jgi:hypothetical protein
VSRSFAAYSWVDAPVEGSPFTIPLDKIAATQNTAILSAYRAAQLLLESKYDGPKHFVVTGNVCHKEGHAWPKGFALSLGKAGSSHLVEIGAKAYGSNGGPL